MDATGSSLVDWGVSEFYATTGECRVRIAPFTTKEPDLFNVPLHYAIEDACDKAREESREYGNGSMPTIEVRADLMQTPTTFGVMSEGW